MRLQLDVNVVNVAGRKHVAVTKLGGMLIRGKPAEDATVAVRNLFWRLAGSDNHEDAELAIELAAAGHTVDDLPQLPDGSDE